MLRLSARDHGVNCAGMPRRSFLQAGFLGFAGLTLADLLRLRSAQAAPKKQTACILVWLDGGPPQHETYDPKPDAPEEYRGAYKPIETSVSGLRLCELMPEQAKMAHRMAFVRSVYHNNGDHFAGAHMMLTGRWGATGADTTPRAPGIASAVARARGANRPGMPPYVGLSNLHSVGLAPGYHGANWLGAQYNPFLADDTTGGKRIGTPNLFRQSADRDRLTRRQSLLEKVDSLRRTFEHVPSVNATDHFTQLALHTLLSPEVRDAFDLDSEPEKVAERYGDHRWSRYCLLARRLVERGVAFVTVNMDGWDMHDNIAEVVKGPAQAMDRAVGSLVRDLDERGMLDHVLVVVMGEFGRTPRLNTMGVPGQTGKPGRDHWGDVMSVAMAGGGLRMGQAVGSSDSKGEYPQSQPYHATDVLATMLRVLEVNPHTEFPDLQGRPMPIIPEGRVISELV
ncbi:MAG: DUF1501 domain-containing protein [Armatimonadota bacterium]